MPSDYLSENEIAAAELAYPAIGAKRLFNPQQQIPMTWPASPAVALSYLDQLERLKAIEDGDSENIKELLSTFDTQMAKGGNNRLSRKIRNLNLSIADTGDANVLHLKNLLEENLVGIASKLEK